MNVENINKLIEWVKADKQRFAMQYWGADAQRLDRSKADYAEPCGTAVCLAGHIWVETEMAQGKYPKDINFLSPGPQIIKRGADYLGINMRDAEDLFYMGYDDYARHMFDMLEPEERAEIGVKVLEHLRDTGEVRWEDFIPFKISSY